MTSKFCVVGSPISHSLSPVLHNAAYQHLGLDFSYHSQEVVQGNLESFLSDSDYEGVSVTMPLKFEAFELSVEQSEHSSLTGAANTLTRTASGWSASNTDVYGLVQALHKVPTPARTAIIGAGATSASALVAIAELFPLTEVSMMARDAKAVAESVEFGLSLGLEVSSSTISADRVSSSDLMLSLVPPGSFEDVWSSVLSLPEPPIGWLFDATYNPWPSLPARAWGSDRVISGLEMLIWQAIAQVQVFSASAGQHSELDRSELYSVMKAAVSGK